MLLEIVRRASGQLFDCSVYVTCYLLMYGKINLIIVIMHCKAEGSPVQGMFRVMSLAMLATVVATSTQNGSTTTFVTTGISNTSSTEREIVTTDVTKTTTIYTSTNTGKTTKAASTTPGPTPCSSAKWLVRETNGDICMLMDFNATITYPQDNGNTVIYIPEKNSDKLSKCDDESASFSVIFRLPTNILMEIVLRFTGEKTSYSMNMVILNLYTAEGVLFRSVYTSERFFTVNNGKYYICDDFNVSVAEFDIHLTSPIFQPFVKKTAEQCGLGEAKKCNNSDGSNGSPNLALIVGCVIGALVVIAAVGVTLYVIKRTKTKPYSAFENQI